MYEMETPCGPIYLHHVNKNATFGNIVAVYRRDDVPTTAEELEAETFALLFPVETYRRRGVCRKIGVAKVAPKFRFDRQRYPFYDFNDRLLYWVLIENGQDRRNVVSLSHAETAWPIAIAPDDVALRELVCAGYNAETIHLGLVP